MTLFEILNFNRELLERLAGTGYKPDDYKYIDLYREYFMIKWMNIGARIFGTPIISLNLRNHWKMQSIS